MSAPAEVVAVIYPDRHVVLARREMEPETLQGYVGGDVEAIGGPGVTFWVNEHGYYPRTKDQPDPLPANPLASSLCGVYVVGAVVVTGPADRNGRTTGVTREWLDAILVRL